MARKRRVLLVVVGCVLAVSLAASTLPATESPSNRGDPGDGDQAPVEGPGEHQSRESSNGFVKDAETNRTSNDRAPPVTGMCVPALVSPTVVLGSVVGFVVAAAVVARRYGRLPALAFLPAACVLAPLYVFFTQCGSGESVPETGVKTLEFAAGEVGQAGSAAAGATSTLSLPALVGVAVALVAVAAAIVVSVTGEDEPPEAVDGRLVDDDGDDGDGVSRRDGDDWAAAADAAGDAADRIEAGADVENEVYRAWRDMTAHVALPDPETSTPGEVAAAAREGGVPAEQVDALTDLFREVRYGGADATEARERAAVDALRAIEAADA